MAFDWFRRRFTKQEEEQAAETEQTQSQADTPVAETPAAPAETTATDAQDYLNWAKAAYQNIQKRQPSPTSPPPISSEPEPTAPPTAAPAITEAALVAETDAIAVEQAVETVEPAPQPTLQAEASPSVTALSTVEPAPGSEPVSETDTIAVEQAVETVEPPATDPAPVSITVESAPSTLETPSKPSTPLPFWVEAEAERLERLERLKETAIADTQPTPIQSQPITTEAISDTTEALPDGSDLALDEGFLWSAEVLAAQGRNPEDVSLEEITWLKRLRQGLDKTRRGLINQLRAIVGQGPLTQDAVMEIEAALLQADVGVEATDAIIDALQDKLRSETLPPDAAISYLKQILRDMLDAPLNQGNQFFAPQKDTLNVWLITGVNGAGKTTTIGKLAHIAQKSGYKCLIAAADTFRAAAVEQVKVWGNRSNVEVIANPGQNTDPAAVVFDAITAAKTRGTELLLVDTAGRLQNKKNLMDELNKVRRIIDKKAEGAIVESLLVLDATLGQNGLRQAEVFSEAASLSGVVLTKLDGTAKGGIALAIVQQLGLPIRFIGAGEGIEDLRPFSSYEFVEALLNG